MNHTDTNDTANRELLNTYLINAPLETVWRAWTDPAQIAIWWGPNGFTNTIHTMNVQPNGEWKFIMHGPDGTDYRNESIFKEVVTHKRLVFEHITGPHFLATIEFESLGNQTFISWRMLFDSEEQFIKVIKVFKANEAQVQNIERLQAFLVTLNT
jgi:uncharacterized protein YndB with AHSA1/START domain